MAVSGICDHRIGTIIEAAAPTRTPFSYTHVYEYTYIETSALSGRPDAIASKYGFGRLGSSKGNLGKRVMQDVHDCPGPIDPSSLSPGAVVARRFGIWQGPKCRPIDNYRESGVNATASSIDAITVHTADVVAASVGFRVATDTHCIWSLERALKMHSFELGGCHRWQGRFQSADRSMAPASAG